MNAQIPLPTTTPSGKTWDALSCSRVGRSAAYGFTNDEIAEGMGLAVEDVAEIRLLPETLAAQQEEMQRRQEQAMMVEDGWNSLEELSLSKLLQMVNYNADPGFILAAARVANQANRKSSGGRRVLDAGRAGTTIVLNLGAKFVNQVQQEGLVDKVTGIVVREKKVSDILNPSQASRLLGVKTETDIDEETNRRIQEELHLDIDGSE